MRISSTLLLFFITLTHLNCYVKKIYFFFITTAPNRRYDTQVGRYLDEKKVHLVFQLKNSLFQGGSRGWPPTNNRTIACVRLQSWLLSPACAVDSGLMFMLLCLPACAIVGLLLRLPLDLAYFTCVRAFFRRAQESAEDNQGCSWQLW